MTRFQRLYSIGSIALASSAWSTATAQDLLFTIQDEGLGRLGGISDVTGDAIPDLSVGAPNFGWGGRVSLYSGLDGSFLSEVLGSRICNKSENVGTASGDAGDFDGDGVPDLVLGAASSSDPLDCNPWMGGKIAVYSGATSQLLVEVMGSSTSDRFGAHARGLGDVDGDGYDDVAGAAQENYVRIYRGPDGTLLREHTGPGLWPSVAAVGDVDGDRHPDYIVGWMQDSTVATYAGKAVVHSGATGAVIHTVYGVAGRGDESHGDHLGRSVAGVGDMDGDGVPDFAAGAPGEFAVGWGLARGFVRVYSGADASILHHIDGDNPLSLFGYGVMGGGDLNGDGVPDLLVGAPYDPQPSAAKGSTAAYSGRTGAMLWRVHGAVNGAWLGDDFQFDVLGDLNLDGHDDWGIADNSIEPGGIVKIFAGAPGDAVRICTAATNSTGSAATIRTRGPISFGNDKLALEVSGGVPGQFGIFFYGSTAIEVPFGNGWRCAGGGLFRFPPTQMNASGFASRAIDFDAPPVNSGPGQWSEGSTWIVQYWYRDPMGGGERFNLSDALAITFTP